MKKTLLNLSTGSLSFQFSGHSVHYNDDNIYSNSDVKSLMTRKFFNMHMIELARFDVNKNELELFMIVLRSSLLLVESSGKPNPDLIRKYELLYSKDKVEIESVIKAKNEFTKSASDVAEPLSKGFRQIYQLINDDDLMRFDFMYSNDADEAVTEKVEVGLMLMQFGNKYRKELRAQVKTFETSQKNRVSIYFPKSDDNIGDGKYSYPKNLVTTSRPAKLSFWDFVVRRLDSAIPRARRATKVAKSVSQE
jgi:hypothetical protein